MLHAAGRPYTYVPVENSGAESDSDHLHLQ